MLPIVVTTGQRYCDLDALACVIAYCEIDPGKYLPVIPGPLNHSVTQTIKKWGLQYKIKPPKEVSGYIIMDVSEDAFLADFVNVKKIVEIYDHHFGFENIWQARPWVKTNIVEIGACATLVWEEIKKRKWEIRNEKSFDSELGTVEPLDIEVRNGNVDQSIPHPSSLSSIPPLTSHVHTHVSPPASQSSFPLPTSHFISTTSANLLYTAIVTHTLNFQISITKDRDRQAAEEIKSYCSLPDDWISQYYREIEADIYRDPQTAIINDTKIADLGGQSIAIGQMEMWLPEDFIKQNKNIIRSALKQFETELWFYSSPCISKGINYLLTDNQSVKEWLKMRVGAIFDKNSDLGTTQKLYLRKEILRELQRD